MRNRLFYFISVARIGGKEMKIHEKMRDSVGKNIIGKNRSKKSNHGRRACVLCVILALLIMAVSVTGCVEKKTFDTKRGSQTEDAVTDIAVTGTTDQAVSDNAADTDTDTSGDQQQEETKETEDIFQDGPVQLTLGSGTELTLTPAGSETFLGQDNKVIVATRIGDTVFKSGSIATAGSALSLGSMRSTETIDKPMAAFSYETSVSGDAAADAIGEAGETAVLIVGGQEYPVLTAWITDQMACFFFGCEELPSTAPSFGVQDGKLKIRFDEDGEKKENTDAGETAGTAQAAQEPLPSGFEAEYTWLSYTLKVDYVKAVKGSEIDKNPMSTIKDQNFVEVRLLAKEGDILTEDINDEKKITQFVITTSGNEVLKLHSTTMRGVTFDAETGKFSTKEKQEGFSLIFELPDGVTLEDLTMTVKDA